MDIQGPGYVTYSSDGRGIDWTPFNSPTISQDNTFSHLKIFGWESTVYNVFANNSTFEYLEIYDVNAVNSATFHPNGIYISTAIGGTVRYSLFRKNTYAFGEGIFFEQSGGASDWKIYGNRFINNDESHLKAIQITSAVSNLEIYNNTFSNSFTSVFVNGGSCTGSSATRNNITYLSGGVSTCGTTDNNTDTDTDIFTDASGGDYTLASALAGVSLGSPFNADPDGATRGADGTWDRGAFEFDSGATIPSVKAGGGVKIGGGAKAQ
jgi:hypothetical protein